MSEADGRQVPRPSSNLWRLVAEGQITEDDVTPSGRMAPAPLSSRGQTIDALVQRYENALREMCAETMTSNSLGSTRSDDMLDERDRRLADLENRLERMQTDMDTLYAALSLHALPSSRPATA